MLIYCAWHPRFSRNCSPNCCKDCRSENDRSCNLCDDRGDDCRQLENSRQPSLENFLDFFCLGLATKHWKRRGPKTKVKVANCLLCSTFLCKIILMRIFSSDGQSFQWSIRMRPPKVKGMSGHGLCKSCFNIPISKITGTETVSASMKKITVATIQEIAGVIRGGCMIHFYHR